MWVALNATYQLTTLENSSLKISVINNLHLLRPTFLQLRPPFFQHWKQSEVQKYSLFSWVQLPLQLPNTVKIYTVGPPWTCFAGGNKITTKFIIQQYMRYCMINYESPANVLTKFSLVQYLSIITQLIWPTINVFDLGKNIRKNNIRKLLVYLPHNYKGTESMWISENENNSPASLAVPSLSAIILFHCPPSVP